MIVQSTIMNINKIKSIKIAIVCLLLLGIGTPAQSQELPAGQAVELASSFWNIGNVKDGEDSPFQINEYKRNGKTYLYLISEKEHGSLIVVNEQRLNGIIAYSDEILSDKIEDAPPAFNTLLQLYMDVVDSVRTTKQYHSRSNTPMRTTRGDTVVYPLLEEGGVVRWAQYLNNDLHYSDSCSHQYNKFCPSITATMPCGKGYVGCTAVAMAQIMWYWKWPDYAWIKPTIDRITGTTYGTPTQHYYDWANMPPAIYDTTSLYQVDAVAGFLRDCGYAAHTKYWEQGSAAPIGDARRALRDTFDYHVTDTHEYSWTEIQPILHSDLENGYPIFCQAWADYEVSAHSFVVDGYETGGTYHINFGWGDEQRHWWFDLGFNGWNVNRTFLTEIYPVCSRRSASVNGISQTSVNNGEALVQYSQNDISFCSNNRPLDIENGGHLVAKAGHQIRLASGFHAKNGSNVHLSVGDICDRSNRSAGSVSTAPKRRESNKTKHSEVQKESNLSVLPNPVIDILHIHSSETLASVRIYDLNGRCLLQTNDTEINVSSLPAGLYVLTAQTASGDTMQTKFIRQ